MEPPDTSSIDRENLRLLSIFHYVLGGIVAVFALFPIMHIFMGIAMLNDEFFPLPPSPPVLEGAGSADAERAAAAAVPMDGFTSTAGVMVIVMGSVFILIGETLAVLLIIAGRKLATHRSHLFCMIVAGFGCFFMPFGTVLGIFTIIVLCRPSVKELFEQAAISPPPPPEGA